MIRRRHKSVQLAERKEETEILSKQTNEGNETKRNETKRKDREEDQLLREEMGEDDQIGSRGREGNFLLRFIDGIFMQGSVGLY